MPNNPTLSTKTLLWSCRSSGFASSTEETRPSRLCEGFYSSYPAILGDQGSVFSYLSFQEQQKTHMDQFWKEGSAHKGAEGAFTASKQRGHCPQGMP